MTQLPTEIWAMIAKHVKREPPPVGEAGNWNDHFHQQDLTSLMRVNQTLYQVVSDVLYRSPVVQNFGLFLLGIEKPLAPIAPYRNPRVSTHSPLAINIGSVLEHKRNLLGKVRKLCIIHASSNEPVETVYMMTRGNDQYDIKLSTCDADKLGTADLASWMLASDLIRQVDGSGWGSVRCGYRNAFRRLETLSFGTWDDGRWKTYAQQAVRPLFSDSDDSDSHDSEYESEEGFFGHLAYRGSGIHRGETLRPAWKACPSPAIGRILRKFFHGSRSFDTCQNALAGIDLNLGFKSSLKIIHNAPLETSLLTGRARVYATTKALNEAPPNGLRVGYLRLKQDSDDKPFFAQTAAHDDSDTDSASDGDAHEFWADFEQGYRATPHDHRAASAPNDFEVCLAPETTGDEGQLQIAMDVKDALVKFKRAAQAKDGTNGYPGRLKILVGTDIPACPCCGGNR